MLIVHLQALNGTHTIILYLHVDFCSFFPQGKWDVPLPKVKAVGEDEVFKVIRTGKSKSKFKNLQELACFFVKHLVLTNIQLLQERLPLEKQKIRMRQSQRVVWDMMNIDKRANIRCHDHTAVQTCDGGQTE